MPIPSVNELMLPILEMLADGKKHSVEESILLVRERFEISLQDMRIKLNNGQYKIDNQIHWVRAKFTEHGLAENLGNGWFQILPCGHYVLRNHADELDNAFLNRFFCPD